MAIGITMYNEDWPLVTRTLKGIAQGIIDIYKDEAKLWTRAGRSGKPNWKEFRDQFVIILIADGYRELTSKQDPNKVPLFHINGSRLGIFDDNIIKDTFFKKEMGKPTTLMSIDDIADSCMRLKPETDILDAEVFEEIERCRRQFETP